MISLNVQSFPKIKKFRNNKASFPLYDALGELYDGHLAEGTYNFTSLDTSQEEEPLQQIVDVEDEEEQGPDEDDDDDAERRTSLDQRNDEEDLDDIREVTVAQNSGLCRATTAPRNVQGKEAKRPKRGARIEEMMERFLEKREEETALMAKQAEEESARRAKQEEEAAARLAREKEAAESNDFSIKRCISVLNTLGSDQGRKGKSFCGLHQEQRK